MAIQTLELNTEEQTGREKTVGFWKRQFLETPTKKQIRFDWVYGVGMPLICVAADPVVFTNDGILPEYGVFAKTLSLVSILSMAAWLLWGKRLGWLGAPLGGLFIAGSFISVVVGVLILPFSLFALLFLIGFLGLTPLFSGLVYFRNGIRAINASTARLDENSVWRTAVLAAMLALVIPYVANAYMETSKGSNVVRRVWGLD